MVEKIFFKKRFGWTIEMTEEKALEMARFIYSKISTKKTAEKVNNRFIGIEFNDYQIDKPL